MGGVEVLHHGQAFLEVRRDRRFDDRAVGLGHQAAHAGKLLHLSRRTTGTGVRHHIDRVDRLLTVRLFIDFDRGDALHHLVGDLVGALRPGVDNLVVLLALGDQTVIVLLLILLNQRARLINKTVLGIRDDHVVLAERDASLRCLTETKGHHTVTEDNRVLLTARAVDGVDHPADFLLGHQAVGGVERHLGVLRQKIGKQVTTGRRVVQFRNRVALCIHRSVATLDLGMQRDDARIQRSLNLTGRTEHHALAGLIVGFNRQVVEAKNHILRRHDDRLTIGRMQDVVRRHHQDARFKLGFERQRHVNGHLVAIEVGVERGTDQRVKLDRLTFDQNRLERLNAQAVQRRSTVQKHRVLADHLIENVPDLRALLLDELLGLLDRVGIALGVQPRIDERLEQLQGHLLRQTTLVQFQFRTGHDDRTTGIVHALAEQVLAEPALLALQHVREGFQRALIGTRDDTAAAAIVEQGID